MTEAQTERLLAALESIAASLDELAQNTAQLDATAANSADVLAAAIAELAARDE